MLDQYDINIFVDEDNQQLNLTAYELMYQNGELCCNTDTYTTLRIPMTIQYFDEIAYLLDNENWLDNIDELAGYDEWNTSDYLKVGTTPKMIAEWADGLLPYEEESVDYE